MNTHYGELLTDIGKGYTIAFTIRLVAPAENEYYQEE